MSAPPAEIPTAPNVPGKITISATAFPNSATGSSAKEDISTHTLVEGAENSLDAPATRAYQIRKGVEKGL